MPENTENSTENRWYCAMFEAKLRAAAAGRIKSALIISMPTHLMESITITAISTTKILSIRATRIRLLFARLAFKLTACSLLKARHQNVSVTAKINKRRSISGGVMLRISPTRSAEYFEKLPPRERMTSPAAVEREEKTEITVSFSAIL